MADNILTKDRAAANLDIAAKDIAGVQFPRNILVDPSGADITPLTDVALRATPVPVSAASLPLPSGAAAETTLAALLAAAATDATLSAGVGALLSALGGLLTDTQLRASAVPVSGPLTDTQIRATALPVSAASLPLPADAATQTTLALIATEATLAARTGSLTETAPASDTASSGINGRLQRIAQRITSLIALLPASLGQQAGASSLSVVEATPTTVMIVSLTTNATGATFNAFASQACQMLDLVNTAAAAVDLEVRRGGSGYTIVVPGGSSRMFVGLSNASDLQVRRLDQSNTQVTVTGEAVAQ